MKVEPMAGGGRLNAESLESVFVNERLKAELMRDGLSVALSDAAGEDERDDLVEVESGKLDTALSFGVDIAELRSDHFL